MSLPCVVHGQGAGGVEDGQADWNQPNRGQRSIPECHAWVLGCMARSQWCNQMLAAAESEGK